jgi:hypothetical protein
MTRLLIPVCSLVPLSMRHNKLSTVVVGTSIVYTVNQGTRNLVRVPVVKLYLINVTLKLDRAMSNSYFDSRPMGAQERSMLGRSITVR